MHLPRKVEIKFEFPLLDGDKVCLPLISGNQVFFVGGCKISFDFLLLGGDKVPRKGGPGITQSDLLVINKTDLAEAVGADLKVIIPLTFIND